MTISTGLLLLIIIGLAWKLRGAQIPHVALGVLFAQSLTPGSAIDNLSLQGLDIFNSVVNAVSAAIGQGNVV